MENEIRVKKFNYDWDKCESYWLITFDNKDVVSMKIKEEKTALQKWLEDYNKFCDEINEIDSLGHKHKLSYDWFKANPRLVETGCYKKAGIGTSKTVEEALFLSKGAYTLNELRESLSCGVKEWIDFNKRITATVTKEILGRKITVTVITKGNRLYAGYSVCSPMDEFDSEKAKSISTGRAMKETTNLLQGETIGTMRGKYLNRAIAFDILNKIEKGKIVIKGIRDANTTKKGTTTEANKTKKR